MKLVLDLIGPPRLMGACQRCELRSGSLAVGRSPEADWVIPDVSRLISRRHLRVDATNGHFVLTDTSANGVYVNGSEEPVGFGASVNLRDGDFLRVGEAQIAVSIETNELQKPPALNGSAMPPRHKSQRESGDPLGGPFGTAFGQGALGQSLERPSDADRGNGSHYPSVDAGWMNEQEVASPRPEEADDGYRFGPQATAPRVHPGPPIETLSVLELVDISPELTLRRLAAAVDAAGQTMDAAAWSAFRKKINQFMRKNIVS